MVAVEVNVEQRMRGFYLELWASAPELFVVAVRSPGGTLMPAQNVPGNSHQNRNLYLKGQEWKLIMHRWDARGGSAGVYPV